MNKLNLMKKSGLKAKKALKQYRKEQQKENNFLKMK
jgi:hypothetical protein